MEGGSLESRVKKYNFSLLDWVGLVLKIKENKRTGLMDVPLLEFMEQLSYTFKIEFLERVRQIFGQWFPPRP